MDIVKQISNEISETKNGQHSVLETPLQLLTKSEEGNKERLQSFQGTVIQRKGSGTTETFTIRKMCQVVLE